MKTAKMIALDNSLQPLKDWFSGNKSKLLFLALLSPT
jgi:hypothetical protein